MLYQDDAVWWLCGHTETKNDDMMYIVLIASKIQNNLVCHYIVAARG